MMSKQELLEKLQEQSHVLSGIRVLELQANRCMNEFEKDVFHIKEDMMAFPKAPAVCEFELKLPSMKMPKPVAKKEQPAKKIKVDPKTIKLPMKLTGAATLVMFMLCGLPDLGFLLYLSILSLAVTIFLAWLYFNAEDAPAELEEFEKARAELGEVLASYETKVKTGLETYKQYEKRYASSYADYKAAKENREKEYAAIEAKLKEDRAYLAKIEVVSSENYHLVNRIIDLLNAGRAEDLKEAQNLAAEEYRHEEAMEEAKRKNEVLEKIADEEERRRKEIEKLSRGW